MAKIRTVNSSPYELFNVGALQVPTSFVFLFLFFAGMGMANLVISLVIRLVTTYLGLLGNDLNLKERLFISISWLPKATVQVNQIRNQADSKDLSLSA